MTDTLMESIWLGVVAAFVLVGLYGAMRSNWPASYVEPTTVAGQLGRFSLGWYLAFRMAPAGLVTSVVAVTADRIHAIPAVAVATCLTLFASFGLVHLLRAAAATTHRLKYLLAGATGVLLSLTGGLAGGVLSPWAARLIPQPAELLNAVWTAVAAAAAYFGLTRALEVGGVSGRPTVRAQGDIGSDAWSYVADVSQANNIPVSAVRAILMAEATQRPRWFRRLEFALQYVRQRFGLSGTTGLAQMRAVEPLSDRESIDLLVADMKEWLSGQEPGTDLADPEAFERYSRRHNPDEVFVTSASDYFSLLADES